MKKIYFPIALIFIILTKSFAQITFSLPTTKFCPGQIFPVEFTFDPSLAGHTFQVQLSNSSGSFASGVSILGSGTISPISCTMTSFSTTSTSLYKIRIIDLTSPTNVSVVNDIVTINALSSSLSSYPMDTLGNITSSATICTGSSLKLFANTSLHDNYGSTYEWKKTSNSTIVISTAPSFIVTQADGYNVKLSKPGCTSRTTSSSVITFSSSILSAVSVIFPGTLNCIGSTKLLRTTYYSDFATYEWKKNGTVINGETGKNLIITTSGYYNVKVIDKTCQGTGGTGDIIFGNNIDVQIESNTDTVKICTGSTHTFIARYAFNNGNTIEWFKDGVSIAPAAPHTFANRFYSTTNEGVYTYRLTEGTCSVMSSPIVLKNVTSFSPKIIRDSENTTCVNPTTLKVELPQLFSGSYQWKNSGNVISGATSTTYTTGTTSGSYTFRLTQGSCSGESDPVNITVVNDNPPYTIVSSPIVCSTGYKLFVNPIYPSYSNTFFQWFKDNIVISGATSNTYNALTSGVYKLRITKNSCIGFSQDLAVSITSTLGRPELVISKNSKGEQSPFQCTGNIVSIVAVDLSPISSVWKRNGVNVINPAGLTNYFYVTQSGNYSLTYTSGSCVVNSDIIKINIGDKKQSIKTNNWNDASSWACGTIPTVTDDVLINKGHTVSLPDNYTGFLKNLELNGNLNKGTNAQLKFQTN
jgi:trimeric autotransporter adhesin